MAGLAEQERAPERRVPLAAAGAACIASSAMLVRLADTTPATTADFRCLLSVPLLAALVGRSGRPSRARPRRARLITSAAYAGFILLLRAASVTDGAGGTADPAAPLLGSALVLGGVVFGSRGSRPGAEALPESTVPTVPEVAPAGADPGVPAVVAARRAD